MNARFRFARLVLRCLSPPIWIIQLNQLSDNSGIWLSQTARCYSPDANLFLQRKRYIRSKVTNITTFGMCYLKRRWLSAYEVYHNFERLIDVN